MIIGDLVVRVGRQSKLRLGRTALLDGAEPIRSEEGEAAQGEGFEEVASIVAHGEDTMLGR
jgi:hypothetical protein